MGPESFLSPVYFLEIFSGPKCFCTGGFEVNWGNKVL